MKNLFLFILIVSSVKGFAQFSLEEKNDDSVKWQTHVADNYVMTYPDTWTLDTSGLMGTTCLVLSELNSEEDKFKENVNLMIQDISAYNLDLNAFTKISIDQISNMIENSRIIENEKIEASSLQAHKLVYAGTDLDFNFIFTQYFWVENDVSYTLTLTIEEENYEEYVKLGQQILNKFQLIP